jgi:hypothetical protein
MEPTTRHRSIPSEVLRWLDRQLAWEQTLAELRDPALGAAIDDEVAA